MTSSIADPVRMVQNAKSLTYTDYYPNVFGLYLKCPRGTLMAPG